jgi:hypothetical protein
MNQPPTAPDPPFGTHTDEALNALLDGELGAFAADHGITEDAARDRLESWPDFATRRAELEALRDAVRAPAPPLDDLTRHRLVRTASNALLGSTSATPSRSKAWARIVAVAAAGLIVVVGIGFAIASTGGGDDSSLSSTVGDSATATAEPLRGNVGDLGDVSSRAALHALLDRREAARELEKDSAESSEGGALAPQNGTSGADSSGGGSAFDQSRAVSPEVCARQLAGERTVAFTGTGTYQGAPVTIIGITERGRTIVFVVPRTDCTTVLASISR